MVASGSLLQKWILLGYHKLRIRWCKMRWIAVIWKVCSTGNYVVHKIFTKVFPCYVVSGPAFWNHCVWSYRFLAWHKLLRSLRNGIIIFYLFSTQFTITGYPHQNKGPICQLQTAHTMLLYTDNILAVFLQNDVWQFKTNFEKKVSVG